jgi:hypothetical protein
VPGEQRRDQWQQGVQVGGQVDVHVGEHLGGAGGPDLFQRAAAPGLLEPDHPDPGQVGGEQGADLICRVRTSVVRDADLGRKRECGVEELPQPSDVRSEVVFLVLDGYDDLDPRMTWNLHVTDAVR